MTIRFAPLAALAVASTMACAAMPASAQRQSAQDIRKQQTAQIPTCARPIGTISVIEPEDAVNWWTGQQLCRRRPS